jgi:hypothetical protein
MLSHIVRKNKLFRALCMMMLLLIHLDAYAYEVISACQIDTQDEMAIPSAADTFQEEDVNVLEWEDLSYSKTSVRSFFWWFILGSLPLFFICFRNFIAGFSEPVAVCKGKCFSRFNLSDVLCLYVSSSQGSKDKSEIYLLDRDSKKDRKMKQDLLKQIDYKPVWLVLDRHIH